MPSGTSRKLLNFLPNKKENIYDSSSKYVYYLVAVVILDDTASIDAKILFNNQIGYDHLPIYLPTYETYLASIYGENKLKDNTRKEIRDVTDAGDGVA